MITTNKEILTADDIYSIFDNYIKGAEYKYLNMLQSYYDSANPEIVKRHEKKQWERKHPNWLIPTAYYSTLTDSLAGYLFSNVKYINNVFDVDTDGNDIDQEPQDEFSELLNKTFEDLNIDVIDLSTGTNAVCFNKSIEYVYTRGDGINPAEIRTVSLDPKSVITIYSDEIEPVLQYAIIFNTVNYKVGNSAIRYELTVISKSLIDYYRITDQNKIISNAEKESVVLVWSQCPVIEYKTEVLNNHSCLHQIIPYIDALDALLTGNQNEIDKLADAILKLSAQLSPEQKKDLNELRVIEGLDKDSVAEFIQRTTDPTFREYVSKLLIQEIHKHSHIIDFYSADGSMTDASGKALKTRLVDMNMLCDRIVKSIKLGFQKRIALFKEFFILDKRISADAVNSNVKVIFNRTPVVGVEDIAQQLTQPTFISDETKQELCGLDPEQEMKRLEEQKENSGFDISDLLPKTEPESNVADKETEKDTEVPVVENKETE